MRFRAIKMALVTVSRIKIRGNMREEEKRGSEERVVEWEA
jgi:hypothetical protein